MHAGEITSGHYPLIINIQNRRINVKTCRDPKCVHLRTEIQIMTQSHNSEETKVEIQPQKKQMFIWTQDVSKLQEKQTDTSEFRPRQQIHERHSSTKKMPMRGSVPKTEPLKPC